MKQEIVNPNDYEEKFWKHNYLISLHNAGEYLVNADCEQDAIDYLIDYCEEKYPGLIMSREEEEEEEFLEEYIMGGNHGFYLNVPAHEMMIEEIK
jgi:hypothetical protein